MPRDLSIFPLNSVLYPEGTLLLQIFEPRYLSMVSDCLCNDKPFVVTLIEEGEESGVAASFREIGTLASINDFNQNNKGLLEISCQGKSLVHIVNHQVCKDELIVGQIEELPIFQEMKLPPEYPIFLNFFKNIVNREGMAKYQDSLKEDWDNPEWLSSRLSEILPLSQSQHYELLIAEPLERFCMLKQIMLNKGWF
ncbi:MAG TPA: hypothetical protein EYG68_04710 [Leucothrix mucor]|nr:hypothetical protein [Leucothrix mucor]